MRFDEMKIDADLLKVAAELGFREPTFVQEKSIPIIKEGRDLFAQSETGSGKTLAFAFPVIERIVHGTGVQCIVIAPTRELADQVAAEFRKFSRHRKISVVDVFGGVSINPQIEKLRNADIVIATPGRLLDHLQRGTIRLDRVKVLVLDEADKMFEMGFIDDVKEIISRTPPSRQTLLFSATISTEVRDIARHYMKNPESVKANIYVDKQLLGQEFYEVPTREKFSLLLHLIRRENPALGMIFCATRQKTDIVARNLQKQGIKAVALHGGHSQNKRSGIMKSFHAGQIHILVATDVAARGLDIKNVSHIFNFDIPKSSQEYVHRIGRTARAGKSGRAISLLSEADFDNFRSVLGDRSLIIERRELPEFEKVAFHVRSYSEGPRRPFRRGGLGNPELRMPRRSAYQQHGDRGFDRRHHRGPERKHY